MIYSDEIYNIYFTIYFNISLYSSHNVTFNYATYQTLASEEGWSVFYFNDGVKIIIKVYKCPM